MIFDRSTELRKLCNAELYNLGVKLNESASWKKLLVSIPKEGTVNEPEFSNEHIYIIEQGAKYECKLPAILFMEEWATYGKTRPTIGFLLELLTKAELFRAADYVAEHLLHETIPPRPTTGPAAAVEMDSIIEMLENEKRESNSTSSKLDLRMCSTSEIPLDQINYPMDLLNSKSAENCNLATADNNVGVIDVNYAQSASNEVFERAKVSENVNLLDMIQKYEEITDMIKFSASRKSYDGNDNQKKISEKPISDLIKFDSTKTHSINGNAGQEILPDFNALRESTNVFMDANCSRSAVEYNELSSSELPACLRDFNDENYFLNARSSAISTQSLVDTTSTSTESTAESSSSESTRSCNPVATVPELLRDMSGGNVLDSQELPITVAELNKK